MHDALNSDSRMVQSLLESCAAVVSERPLPRVDGAHQVGRNTSNDERVLAMASPRPVLANVLAHARYARFARSW